MHVKCWNMFLYILCVAGYCVTMHRTPPAMDVNIKLFVQVMMFINHKSPTPRCQIYFLGLLKRQFLHSSVSCTCQSSPSSPWWWWWCRDTMSDLASAWDAAWHEMVVLQQSFFRFVQTDGIRYFCDVSSDLMTSSCNIEILTFSVCMSQVLHFEFPHWAAPVYLPFTMSSVCFVRSFRG